MTGQDRLPQIKCVVWDLDNTLWSGVLSEGDDVVLAPRTAAVVRELDRRGILQSIASRNDHDDAWRALERFGLTEFFIEPRIDWTDKSLAMAAIRDALNIGADAMAFVDDQVFEREEVAAMLPEVRCYDAAEIAELLDRAEFNPRFVTAESAQRRTMYMQDRRRDEEDRLARGSGDFAATLGLKVAVSVATVEDLQRIEELTVRTSQLNASGFIFSYDELVAFVDSPRHLLLAVQAEDRFGDYGKIGAALIETHSDRWILKLLTVSCRVMSRGIGGLFLSEICWRADELGRDLYVEFRQTDRNRAMLIALRFAGFKAVSDLAGQGSLMLREGALPQRHPGHVEMRTPWTEGAAA